MERLSDLFRRKMVRDTEPRLPVVRQSEDLSGDWEEDEAQDDTLVKSERIHRLFPAGRKRTSRNPIQIHVPRPQSVVQSLFCPTCQGAGYLRADVPYGHPGFGKPVACQCKEAELKEKQQQHLAKRSDILGLSYFQDATLTTFRTNVPGVQDAYEASVRFAAEPWGWLILAGPTGSGKTHLGVAIAKKCLEDGYIVLAQSLPEVLLDLQSAPWADAGKKRALDEIRMVDVLVLDDWGVESDTPWVRQTMFEIFNYRYNACLPTVVTTNLMDRAQRAKVDPRIASRMADVRVATCIQMQQAGDYRDQNGQSDDEMEEVQGPVRRMVSVDETREHRLPAVISTVLRSEQGMTVAELEQLLTKIVSRWPRLLRQAVDLPDGSFGLDILDGKGHSMRIRRPIEWDKPSKSLEKHIFCAIAHAKRLEQEAKERGEGA